MRLLDAIKNQNRGRPPVWLMRQAGRYMPSYRALREKHSLFDLFFTPELAAKITLMPVEQLGVDAAILFSDITVTALALGFSLTFNDGPVIAGELNPRGIGALEPIAQAIKLIKPQLKVPLIGFCGGPFTVASYINQKNPSLIEEITKITIEYIHLQEKAGVDVIQIFDSWADRMNAEEFRRYCPYLKRLIEAAHVPVIFFMRGASERIHDLVPLKPDVISFDAKEKLSLLRKEVPMAVQGNLDPDLLFAPFEVIRQKTEELLHSMQNDPGFIVNLGHGIKPGVPFDSVRCLIDTVIYLPG